MSDEAPLDQRVKEWLRTQGYPLEMRVAEAFRDAGFTITQSAYFNDPSSGKAREIDVVARKSWDGDNIQWQLILIIECKVSKKQPWVLFTRALETNDTGGQFQFYTTRASMLGRQLLARVRRHTAARTELPLLEFNERPGYGLQRATVTVKDERSKADNRDVPFEAASKVVHAATLHAAAVDTVEYAETPVGQIVLPMIVIDGHLFDVHLDDARELVVAPRQSGVLDWNNPVAGTAPTWVRILTADALDTVAAEARRTAEYLEHGCLDLLAQIDKRWLEQFEAKQTMTPAVRNPVL